MERPPVAVGHVVITSPKVDACEAFYTLLGLRPVLKRATMAILELRGGTHLLIFKGRRTAKAPFDLIVDDVKTFRAGLVKAGLEATKIRTEPYGGHHLFDVQDPDGRKISILSTHTEGRTV